MKRYIAKAVLVRKIKIITKHPNKLRISNLGEKKKEGEGIVGVGTGTIVGVGTGVEVIAGKEVSVEGVAVEGEGERERGGESKEDGVGAAKLKS